MWRFSGDRQIIQYESEPGYESAEYATRKPANRHFNAARPQYPATQNQPGDGIKRAAVFYESVSSGD